MNPKRQSYEFGGVRYAIGPYRYATSEDWVWYACFSKVDMDRADMLYIHPNGRVSKTCGRAGFHKTFESAMQAIRNQGYKADFLPKELFEI